MEKRSPAHARFGRVPDYTDGLNEWTMKKVLFIGLALATLFSCAKDGFPEGMFEYPASKDDGMMMMDGESGAGREPGGEPGGGSGNGQSEAGRLTAGEWNDLENWDFWGKLMTSEDHGGQSAYWGFYTNNRIAVRVVDTADKPVADAKVALMRGGKAIWEAVTDNSGYADLFVGLFQKEEADAASLSVSVNGNVQEGAPQLTDWTAGQGPVMNKYTVSATAAPTTVDIAFIVDATGSMGDEILFLKDDLMDILTKAQSAQAGVKYRTAALFYRDEGDDYLTRPSNFNTDFSVTHDFIKDQRAGGGGDYPEAVHTALEQGLQSLSWSESARNRLAFLILDAPAHYRPDVIKSLQSSIGQYARLGIRIIPVAASGVDKSTEFMCRFFAVSTGGTYVFLTDDSGIGGSHIEPTVGKYTVELLNDLLLRLIGEYSR